MVINTKQEFSNRLIEALDDMGFAPEYKGRQVKLGNQFDVSQNAAGKWLKAGSIPSYERLIQLSKFLGVNTEWLIAGSGPKRPLEFGITDISEWKGITKMDNVNEEVVKQVMHEMSSLIVSSGISINKNTRIELESEIYQEIEDVEESELSPTLIRKLITLILKERNLL